MHLKDFPIISFVVSFVILSLGAEIGNLVRKQLAPLKDEERADFGIVLGAALTLLGLLIGFTFSMSVSRYDQRKNYEESEANAIGTEYVRADLLPPGDAAEVRALLKKYLDQRVLFYTTRDLRSLAKINADTTELQTKLWSAVRAPAVAQQTPVMALVVSGMNDVLNSQGYTQAAWWNRIPRSAWVLMLTIGFGCNVLIGFSARKTERRLFLIVPIAASMAFFLITDIDSPRRGTIHVTPMNLLALSQSLAQ